MSAWVLLLLLSGGPATIDMPNRATCERVLAELRATRFGGVVGHCISREPAP